MNLRALKAPAVLAAALMVVVAAGCTDTTVAPKSTVTSANVFKDQNAYEQLIARVYSGLAVSGQQGPAGNPDIQGIDEGFSQYLRLYWELEELPTDEAVIGWNDQGLPPLNTDTWTAQSRMVVAMYYRIFFQVVMANEFLRETSDSALASRASSRASCASAWSRAARYGRGSISKSSCPLRTSWPRAMATLTSSPPTSAFTPTVWLVTTVPMAVICMGTVLATTSAAVTGTGPAAPKPASREPPQAARRITTAPVSAAATGTRRWV